MTKINCIEDLPDWFELDKYDGTKEFDASDWYEHLIYRKEIHDALPYITELKCNDTSPIQHDTHNRYLAKLQALQQKPLHTFGDKYYTPIGYPDKKPIKPLSFLHLREQFKNDKYAVNNNKASPFSLERWLFIEANTRQVNANSIQLQTPIVLTKHDDGGHQTHVISVDLRVTNSLLVKAFARWLGETRAQQSASKKRNCPAYKNWTRYGLLPYLDLYIWSETTKTHIPHHVYSKAISKFDKGENFISKTLSYIALSLLDDLSELQALAQQETI